MPVLVAHGSESETFPPFRAPGSASASSSEVAPDDIKNVIWLWMDAEALYCLAFASKSCTALVCTEIQARLPDLISKLSKLPAEYNIGTAERLGGFYTTLTRKFSQPCDLAIWDNGQFEKKFKELFLLKEMSLGYRYELPYEFQELLAYVKPMLAVAILTPLSGECLCLGIQGAYILLTKPRAVSCPMIDAFYVKNDEHQKTYLNPKIVKTIENVCLNVLSKKDTLDLLFDLCYGMTASSKIHQYPLTFDDVRATGRALTKINLKILYPELVHMLFLELIINGERAITTSNGLTIVSMGAHIPRIKGEKCADFDLLREVYSHQYTVQGFKDCYGIRNYKTSKKLVDYTTALDDEAHAARFKESSELDELVQ
jgi:hypothetical protein